MIELISSLFKEGDFIRLFFNNSSRSVEGTIIKILPSSIAIKSIDGKISGVKGDDIDSFDSDSSAKIDNIVSEENNELTPLPVDSSIVKEEKTVLKDASNEEGVEAEQSDQKVQPLFSDKDIEIKEQASKADNTEKKSISQYKPGDVIPLEVLHRIDPKLKKKKTESTKSIEIPGKRSALFHQQSENSCAWAISHESIYLRVWDFRRQRFN